MRLPINHEKYTHVDIRGYRKRENGETRYDCVVVPAIVDGIWVRTEAYAGYCIHLYTCKRASHSAEDHARELAATMVSNIMTILSERYGFDVPAFDNSLLTFTVC